MDPPKTRTETKKQGKLNAGPYSAKHVRMQAELAATRAAKKGKRGRGT